MGEGQSAWVGRGKKKRIMSKMNTVPYLSLILENTHREKKLHG